LLPEQVLIAGLEEDHDAESFPVAPGWRWVDHAAGAGVLIVRAGIAGVKRQAERRRCASCFLFVYAEVHEAHPVKDGLHVEYGRHKEELLRYAEMEKVVFSPGAFAHADILLHMRGKRGSYFFEFLLRDVDNANAKVERLQKAITTLMDAAQSGKSVVCSDNPEDYKVELDEFEKQVPAARAAAAKPGVSDEVYKDRLLAEDALKNRDLDTAAKFYEDGIAADPTWDQGWYNAALVYAELNDYLDAAQSMRHYVLLVPDASDVRAAKDNIILWEAKAARASRGGTPSQQSGGAIFNSMKQGAGK
jgi:tetratricopeptide (TPR) repeat protein